MKIAAKTFETLNITDLDNYILEWKNGTFKGMTFGRGFIASVMSPDTVWSELAKTRDTGKALDIIYGFITRDDKPLTFYNNP